MDLSELSPFPVFVTWEGQAIELKPFDLRAITWSERFFFKDGKNGFNRMMSILRNDEGQVVLKNTIVDIVFYLGSKDFLEIGIESAVEFKRMLFNSNEIPAFLLSAIETAYEYRLSLDDSRLEIFDSELNKAVNYGESLGLNITAKLEEYKTAIEQVIENSFVKKEEEPEVKGGSIYQALRAKSKKASEESSTDWERVYSDFLKYSGMNIDDFYKLTTKQIDAILPELSFKRNEELNILSDLIHKKIVITKPRRKPKPIELTEKDREEFNKMYNHLVEERRIH